jgi:SAM-dependent methyltransferase
MIWALTALFLLILGSMAYAAASGAPWVPTWRRDMERAARLLDLQAGERFVELGCGDGRFCTFLASTTQAEIVGVELSVFQYLVAKLRAKFFRNTNGNHAVVEFGNAFSKNLSSFDAVYLFLMPDAYEKIRPKLEAELKPGTRVVSYVWPISKWQTSFVDEQEDQPDLYLYIR